MKYEIVVENRTIEGFFANQCGLARVTNDVLEEVRGSCAFEFAGLRSLPRISRLYDYVPCGINYQDGDSQLAIDKEWRGKHSALVILGTGGCEAIAESIAEKVKKLLPVQLFGGKISSKYLEPSKS